MKIELTYSNGFHPTPDQIGDFDVIEDSLNDCKLVPRVGEYIRKGYTFAEVAEVEYRYQPKPDESILVRIYLKA